jgi:hypothetical protein
MINLEVRLFNSLSRYAGARNPLALKLPEGATIGDALARLPVPAREIFLLTLNGRNVLAGVGLEPGSWVTSVGDVNGDMLPDIVTPARVGRSGKVVYYMQLPTLDTQFDAGRELREEYDLYGLTTAGGSTTPSGSPTPGRPLKTAP